VIRIIADHNDNEKKLAPSSMNKMVVHRGGRDRGRARSQRHHGPLRSLRLKVPVPTTDGHAGDRGDSDQAIIIVARRFWEPTISPTHQCHIELALNHSLDKFAQPIAYPGAALSVIAR
jgi:hypothetical protein